MKREPTSTNTWPDLLEDAQTPRDILALVRDFIATWTPEEVNALPKECRPPMRFQEPEDVVLYAFNLSKTRLGGDESAELDRMWRFFVEASQRVGSAMHRKATDPANS